MIKMRTIFHIIRKEFIQVFRDKPMLGVIFVAPIIQIVLLGYAVTTDIKRISLAVCDLDNSSSSRELIRGFEHSGYFNINFYEKDPSAISDYLDKSKASLVLVIPEKFSHDLQRQLNPEIQLLLDGQDSNSSLIAMGYANGIIQSFIMQHVADELRTKPVIAQRIHLVEPETRIWYNPNLLAKNYMVPSIVALLLTIITTMLTAMGIVREKEIGTLEQLMVSPIKPLQLMIGKTVPFAILGMFEITFALTVAKLWYNIPIIGNLGLFALFALVFMFTTLGMGIFISTVSRSQQQSMFLAWFLLVFMIIMSGFLFPIENMPLVLRYLSCINPLRYFVLVVRELFLKGSGMSYLWDQGVIMLVFSLIIITLSAIRFQKRMK